MISFIKTKYRDVDSVVESKFEEFLKNKLCYLQNKKFEAARSEYNTALYKAQYPEQKTAHMHIEGENCIACFEAISQEKFESDKKAAADKLDRQIEILETLVDSDD